MTTFLDSNNTLSEAQAGFRSGYSPSDHIFNLYSLINYAKLKKKKLFVAFIDFQKAFDNVWRIGLWKTILNEGINGKFLRIIQNMYSSIKSCVARNNKQSTYFQCCEGVRQGENLSPMLFALYLNDLESYLQNQSCNGISLTLDDEIDLTLKLFVLLYADDTILLSLNKDDLQLQLNAFSKYCNEWKLKINIEKTKVVIFNGTKKDYFILVTRVYKMLNHINTSE